MSFFRDVADLMRALGHPNPYANYLDLHNRVDDPAYKLGRLFNRAGVIRAFTGTLLSTRRLKT
jgi:hypothetical protein